MIAQGYYTSVVVIMHPDRDFLQSIADKVKVAIEAEAFSARIETINNLEAFMGSLPGHGVENVRRPLINTMNLADLLPTSSIWNGRRMPLSTLSCEFSRAYALRYLRQHTIPT